MEWPRGEAAACKAVYAGSNPVSTSNVFVSAERLGRLAQLVARFPDTEEVIGSSPVSPTSKPPDEMGFQHCAGGLPCHQMGQTMRKPQDDVGRSAAYYTAERPTLGANAHGLRLILVSFRAI